MTTNGIITIYHFDEEKDEYARVWIGGASIYRKRQILSEKNGERTASEAIIRIPTARELKISCGDYIYIGKGARLPEKEKCFYVTGYSDNRRGGLKHWRIDCDKRM